MIAESANRKPGRYRSREGFALVITLSLLAMLVLTMFALTTLAKINSRISSASMQHTRARGNALVALTLALGELQRHAGPDNRVTGMAGVTGIGPGDSLRHWTGVWGSVPSPVWLSSGASGSDSPSLSGARLKIVGGNTVGSPSDPTDQESVEVGLIDLPGIDAQGRIATTGRIAYWVGDEGVKVSAVIPDADAQTGGGGNLPLRPNLRGLVSTSFDGSNPLNAKLLSLEQLKSATTGYSLFKSFHSLTLAHHALATTAGSGTPRPGDYVTGAFNVNTTSEAAWRSLLELPDSTAPFFGLNTARTLSGARGIRDHIAGQGRPFSSIAELLNSNVIQQSFDEASPRILTPTQEEFVDELTPILAVRSDTFRIRAYGDTLDLADHAQVEATAWCEAIVQRTPELVPGGLGRRFVVTYFRWLGPDDI